MRVGRRVAAMVVGLAHAACSPQPVTYEQDIAPLLQRHCLQCHTENGPGYPTLLTYEDVRRNRNRIAEAVESERMPPWTAYDSDTCAPPLPWVGDRRLSDNDKRLLRAFAEAPERGQVAAAPPVAEPLPAPPPVDANLVVTTPPRTLISAHDETLCSVHEINLDTTKYLKAWQFTPGNTRIVHHATLAVASMEAKPLLGKPYVLCNELDAMRGAQLANWGPGGGPGEVPANAGVPIPANSLLLIEIHYGPVVGEPQEDVSSFALALTEDATRIARSHYIGDFTSQHANGDGLQLGLNDPHGVPTFLVPYGQTTHTERMQFTWNGSKAIIYGLKAHAHLAANDIRVWRQRGDELLCLLRDRWNFHWQLEYRYDGQPHQLPTLDFGDKLIIECQYLNSESNELLRAELNAHGQPFQDLPWGQSTLAEMCSTTLFALDPCAAPGTTAGGRAAGCQLPGPATVPQHRLR